MLQNNILNIKIIKKVAVVTLDTPGEKVNKLNEKLIDEFSGFLDKLESDPGMDGAVLMSGKEENFIAGADIEMFKERGTAEELEELSRIGNNILFRVENFSKPIVAGIHGSCMGGGTELALACHYRIISDHTSTKIALPEVKLGLLPGMGGTQRLPRLIGIQKALTYMLTGKNMYSRQADKMGFADEVTHPHAIKKAGVKAVIRLKKKKKKKKDKRTFIEKVVEGNPIGRNTIFKKARERTLIETRGNYPAPMRIIESVEYGYKNGFKNGLKNESKLFGELAVTPESRALVQLFFGMNAAKKNPFEKEKKQVKNIGVLGAGLMGSGIAEITIEQGHHVWLKDQSLPDAMTGELKVRRNLDQKVSKKIISEFERDRLMSQIHTTESYDRFQNIDLVVEAVFEDIDIKKNIVREIENYAKEYTIIASNTSSLPISKISSEAFWPEKIIGMHYFSPVSKMPLLEIVKTGETADWVIGTAFDLGLRQGKTVIVVNDGPGFYTTRILAPFMNETLFILEEGASIEQIDKVMKDFGFPVGPIALFDEVGIDVGAHVADVLSKKFESRGGKTSKKAKELLDAGYKGRKNTKGFYKYEKGSKKKKEVNEEIYKFFGGSKRKSFSADEIEDRLILMMLNEAVYCLQEDILEKPVDGDLGAVLGLGFPPFLGGPFRYIDNTGSEEIQKKMDSYYEKYGKRFKPADLLVEMTRRNGKFYED